MKSWSRVLGLLLGVIFLGGCAQEVQTGRIVTCKQCGVQIENSVSVIKVPIWKANDYQVSRLTSYCQKCGDEQVSFKIDIRCQRCGNTYSSRTENADRRTEPHDRSTTEGFCSTVCERGAKVDNAIDNVSRKTGDVMGRIGRGIFDGARKYGR